MAYNINRSSQLPHVFDTANPPLLSTLGSNIYIILPIPHLYIITTVGLHASSLQGLGIRLGISNHMTWEFGLGTRTSCQDPALFCIDGVIQCITNHRLQKQFDDMAISGNVVGGSGRSWQRVGKGTNTPSSLPSCMYIDFSLMQRDISECEVHSTPLIEWLVGSCITCGARQHVATTSKYPHI